MRIHFATLVLLVSSSACLPTLDGLPDGGVQEDFGRQQLANAEAECPAAGERGAAVLGAQPQELTGPLAYRTAEGTLVDATEFVVELAWPAEPVFVCYPQHLIDGDVVADARVGMEGVGLRFVTTDGRFNETLTANVFRLTATNGSTTNTLVAVTTRPSLVGTFEPATGFDGDASTVIITLPVASSLPNRSGSVSLSRQPVEEVLAGIIRNRSTVAFFPATP